MADLISLFQGRTLHARPPGGGVLQYVRPVLTTAMFLGLIGFSVFWVAPTIWTDYQIRDAAVPIRGSHLEGKCSERLFIHTCDVTLTAPGGGVGTITRTVHYVFGSFTTGGFTADVVADPRRPEWLTTDLALDRFYDRIITLLIETALLVGVTFVIVKQAVSAGRFNRNWRRAKSSAVPLQLVRKQNVKGGSQWTVRTDDGRTASWVFPRKAKPFVLGPGNDRVLGLAAVGGGLMPLDAGLRWVDLTTSERSAVLASRA